MVFKDISIGRDLNCDIVVDSRYTAVSGRHAVITLGPNSEILFRDTSRNGSMVNGMPVNQTQVKVAFGTPIVLAGCYQLPWNRVKALLGAANPTQMQPTVHQQQYGAMPPQQYQQPNNHQNYPPQASQQNPKIEINNFNNIAGGVPGLPPEAGNVDESFLGSWSWGAFFMGPVWGFGNGCWWYFLVAWFFPITQILMGIFGTRLAWNNKHWDNFYQFKVAQQTWAKAGIISFLIVVVVIAIYFLIALLFFAAVFSSF